MEENVVGFWYVFMFILAEEIIQMCGNISLSAEEEHGVTLPSMGVRRDREGGTSMSVGRPLCGEID
jgi:hypothetical protein